MQLHTRSVVELHSLLPFLKASFLFKGREQMPCYIRRWVVLYLFTVDFFITKDKGFALVIGPAKLSMRRLRYFVELHVLHRI